MALGFGGQARPKVRWRRVGPGFYEADTPKGVYRVEHIEVGDDWKNYFLTKPTLWNIWWPGEDTASESRDTLRDAKWLVERDVERGQ